MRTARTIVSMLISAVSIYALAVTYFFLFEMGDEPTQGSTLILIPPKSFIIILMVIPAGLYGIVCGGALSALANFANASTSNLLKTSGISGLILPLFNVTLTFADSFERTSSQSPSELGLVLIALWAIGSVSNLITLWLVGRMFRPEPTLP